MADGARLIRQTNVFGVVLVFDPIFIGFSVRFQVGGGCCGSDWRVLIDDEGALDIDPDGTRM